MNDQLKYYGRRAAQGLMTRREFAGRAAAADDDGEAGLSPGQRVHHSKFGEGTVLQLEGRGQHARVQVNFARDGAKWLVMQYARLEPL